MKTVHGAWATGFEGVSEAFVRNLAESEVGAACCVYWNGEPVVDVWGGLADREGSRPWQRDTAALVFSSDQGGDRGADPSARAARPARARRAGRALLARVRRE